MRKLYYPAGLSLLLAVILTVLCIASAVAEDINYTENEWNYVDGSMDVSHGIPENATGVLGRIRRNGVLRVATEPYFAPQEFIDPALTEDQCDLTVSAISFTPGRATAYALSKGYYYADSEASTGFVIREADREEITSIDSLKNKTIIAQSTSLQESLAASHIYSAGFPPSRRFTRPCRRERRTPGLWTWIPQRYILRTIRTPGCASWTGCISKWKSSTWATGSPRRRASCSWFIL